MSCNVCAELFNKKSHSPVECDFCEYTACRNCCESYILSRPQMAHCMNCKKEWDYHILVKNFKPAFLNNNYKKHRQQILFENETDLFAATQPLIEEEKRKILLKNEIANIRKEIQNLKISIKKYDLSKDEKSAIRKEINNLNEVNKKKQYEMLYGKNASNIYIKKCTNLNCKGFLDKNWFCSLCETTTCSKCLETQFENHICKQENIETARLLETDSKQCPKCGILIFKTDGCNQMWCTKCHTAFDWVSGRIQVNVHNPHYYEWLRTTRNIQRNPADIECGRIIDFNFTSKLLELMNIKMATTSISTMEPHKTRFEEYILIRLRSGEMNIKDIAGVFCNYTYRVSTIRTHCLPKFSIDRLIDNEKLRISFCKNELSEQNFKKELEKRDYNATKNQELFNITNMYITCATDIIYRYVDEINSGKHFINTTVSYKLEIEFLRVYTQELLDKISKTYKCKRYTYLF